MPEPTKEELELMMKMILGKGYDSGLDPSKLIKGEDAYVGPHPDWNPKDGMSPLLKRAILREQRLVKKEKELVKKEKEKERTERLYKRVNELKENLRRSEEKEARELAKRGLEKVRRPDGLTVIRKIKTKAVK